MTEPKWLTFIGIAVERNRQIVGKDLLNSVTLEDGDKVEIIRIVSGG